MPSKSDTLTPVSRGGRATIAVNPFASRFSQSLIDHVAQAAREAGHAVEVTVTGGAGDMSAYAARSVERGDDLFVVVGGDGSVAEAASRLSGSAVPLLIVPAGTGNLLAAALGQPRDAKAATRILHDGLSRVIDVGEAEVDGTRRTFTVAAGIGFDAAVMAATPKNRKRRLGQLAYLFTAIRLGVRIPETRYRIITPDCEIEADASVVLVVNCLDRVLGVLRPRVPIDPIDGLLEVFVVPGSNGISLVASATKLLRSGVTTAPVPHGALRLRASEVRLEAGSPQPIELDGDPHPATVSVTMRSVGAALRVLAAR